MSPQPKQAPGQAKKRVSDPAFDQDKLWSKVPDGPQKTLAMQQLQETLAANAENIDAIVVAAP